MEIYGEWQDSHPGSAPEDMAEAQARAADQALEEIKRKHQLLPKYDYATESYIEFVRRTGIKVVEIRPNSGQITSKEGEGLGLVTPEIYATRFFEADGYRALFIESSPFHALFAIFLSDLIQDKDDPELRAVHFGRRDETSPWTDTLLPSDFGTPGYAERRSEAITAFFSRRFDQVADLRAMFEAGIEPSERLRTYLWAHSSYVVQVARELAADLPKALLVKILRYLVDDYWGRYLGWPDLFLCRGAEFKFVEVKWGNDQLSDEQRDWVEGNLRHLSIPFELLKIHRL